MADLPFLDLERQWVDPIALASIPEEVARENKVIAVANADDGRLIVTFAEGDEGIRRSLEFVLNREIEAYWSFREAIVRVIDKHYPAP